MVGHGRRRLLRARPPPARRDRGAAHAGARCGVVAPRRDAADAGRHRRPRRRRPGRARGPARGAAARRHRPRPWSARAGVPRARRDTGVPDVAGRAYADAGAGGRRAAPLGAGGGGRDVRADRARRARHARGLALAARWRRRRGLRGRARRHGPGAPHGRRGGPAAGARAARPARPAAGTRDRRVSRALLADLDPRRAGDHPRAARRPPAGGRSAARRHRRPRCPAERRVACGRAR